MVHERAPDRRQIPPRALSVRPRRLRERRALSSGAAYFVALALLAMFLGTWTDEEYTLATTAHGFAFAWQRAIGYELQAPLYFGVLSLWREIDASVWFARLFSILCATGFFFTLLAILPRVAPGRPPLVPALLIALNPFVVYCAFDIRLYAPALLITALGWLAFDAGFGSGNDTSARVWFGVLVVVAVYTQYFLAFAFIGYAVTLLVKRRFRALVPYLLVLAATAIPALPLLFIVRSQIGGSGETTASALSLLRQTAIHPWLEFALPYDANWDALHLHAAFAALCIALILAIAYARPRLGPNLGAAVACVATIEALFVAVVLVFHLALDTRHYAVLFAPVMIAGWALVATLEDGPRPWVGTFVAWAYGVLAAAALFAQHAALAQTGDTKRVAAYLVENAGRGALVAVFPADALPAYAREYHGPARLVPFPKALPTSRYDIGAIDVHSEREALQALAALPAAPQLWLVMLGSCDKWSQSYGCAHVLAAVRDGSRIVSDRQFFDGRVFELAPLRSRAAP